MSTSHSPLAPLKYPLFRAIWVTSLLTNFGGLIQSVGASWMMTSIGTTQMTALVQASVTLPIMLFSLTAGALADTMDRRKIMLAAQTFMLLVSVALSIMAFNNLLSPWVLLGFTFLIGCGVAFNGPAWQASVGDIVPREQLASAVTLNSMGFNLARSLGPALGGVIVAIGTAAAAFAINALSYIGLLVVLFRWKPQYPQQTLPAEGLVAAMGGGVRYAFLSPRIYSVLLRALLFGIGASGLQALMPVIARHEVGGGPLVYGILLGSFGVGAVGGALLVSRMRERFRTETLVRMWICAFAIASLGVAHSPALPLIVVSLLLGGMAWVIVLSTFNVTVQLSAPRWVVARALALYQMAAFGGMAGGAWLWGYMAQNYSIPLALTCASALLVVCLVLGLRLPLADSEELNLTPLARWKEPDTELHIEPRSGPIIVSIAYHIDDDDVPAFLKLMEERRRIRRRDGAHQWRMMRDLADPNLWVEKYQTATWLDYIRHNQRMTHDDARVTQAIRELHRGEDKPVVHRMILRTTGSVSPHLHTERNFVEPMTDPTRAS